MQSGRARLGSSQNTLLRPTEPVGLGRRRVEAGGGGGTHSRHHCRPCGVRGHVTGTRLCGLGRGCRRHGLLSAPWVATCLSPRGPGEGGHSLVVVVFHELLELLDVAHGLQVLLHVGQGREVICKRQTNPEASVPLHLWARNETCRDHRFWRYMLPGYWDMFGIPTVANGPLSQTLCWALDTEGSSGLGSALEECPRGGRATDMMP